MNSLKKAYSLFDNYVTARLLGKSSTAQFWYLPEPANLKDQASLLRYQNKLLTPFYLMDYRQKLKYSLINQEGIIVLPYQDPIGDRVNPEAAFQYALGLHEQYLQTHDEEYLQKFWVYVDYFLQKQSAEGDWEYDFDWYESKAPWTSALAQARGASVMLRAWLYRKENKYLIAALNAIQKFDIPTQHGGFLHTFNQENCQYFEEYPGFPQGVINGFIASLFGIWELSYWAKDKKAAKLWEMGVESLRKMLPYYSVNGWSLYDLDQQGKQPNFNSPRYHLLMINYLLVMSVLCDSDEFRHYYDLWTKNNNLLMKAKTTILKAKRKILYR